MPTQRLPLAHNIATRDGTLQKDAKVGNAFIEIDRGENVAIVKRPGLVTYQSATAGEGRGIFSTPNHFLSIVGTTLYVDGVASGTVDGSDEYDFVSSVDNSQVFLKNEAKAYVYTFATNTLLDLSGTITTQSATTNTTATVTLSASNSAIQVGQNVTGTNIASGTSVLTISGTTLTLSQSATGTGSTTLTFTTNYPTTTVSGAAFLDGYYVVGTPNGLIYNSNLEDPTTWQAINYIGVVSDSDQLVAVNRTYNYIVAIGTQTTEFFYDAGLSPGSPFLPYQSNVLQFGLAAEDSVVQMDNTLVWVSQSKQRGRQVMALNGVTPQVVSTAYIDKVLDLSLIHI